MDRNYIIEIFVGLFVIIGLAAFSFLVLRVSGIAVADYGNTATYSVYASFDNIGGLRTRAKVTMSGVKVGSVANIGFDRDSQQAVVQLSINDDIDFLTTDTSAAIQTSGILGEQYLELTSGADEEILEDGDEITFTQSALILENLISRFLFERGKDE
ncbi:MAG: outer membrane lipid asymmetry maintenance protein MlaD [Gammaproteobacteria bacterium]|nr:outer membrane lipid asymmetry maintenance protein MlaD [Gammaproteobacteria bacterium]